MNENAKLHAFDHELPEADHNEIVGWDGAHRAAPSQPSSSPTPTSTPACESALELTAKRSSRRRRPSSRVETEGENRTERLLWTVMLGDLVSLHLAAHGGVDPAPVDVIERLKDGSGAPSSNVLRRSGTCDFQIAARDSR